jgi:acyl-CoA thioesterase-1
MTQMGQAKSSFSFHARHLSATESCEGNFAPFDLKRHLLQMDRNSMRQVYRFCAALALCWAALSGATHATGATTIRILALGASNTNGVGVSTSEAWPARLEGMLRKRGYDAHVSVNAINGETSAQVLARASAIEPGTQVVIFDNGGDNDRKHGMSMAETNADVARIIATIRAHGAIPIRAPYKKIAGAMNSGGAGYQMDGHHLTAQSHARVAAALVPLVIAAVKRHK